MSLSPVVKPPALTDYQRQTFGLRLFRQGCADAVAVDAPSTATMVRKTAATRRTVFLTLTTFSDLCGVTVARQDTVRICQYQW